MVSAGQRPMPRGAADHRGQTGAETEPAVQGGKQQLEAEPAVRRVHLASMTTRGLHSWMYGRFEMWGRIDILPACGRPSGVWESSGLGPRAARSASTGILPRHTPGQRRLVVARAAVPQWDTAKTLITDFNEPKWSSRFHVWRMDWDPNCIR